MTGRPLVILHGWSDDSSSFDALTRHLASRLTDFTIERVSIGDYLSMHDDVRFDDLQAAMERAWSERSLPRKPHSVDAIVHSTGGLVIRDWLDRNFAPDKSPIKHLVMLAPANFGSPLAHKGRSFLGRTAKGFFSRQPNQPLFNTGTHILDGLELASPYSWDLAMRDRFGRGKGRYAPGRVLCTVLMGNTGYSGIRAIANEVGGDGTVRTATANLQCAHLSIRFESEPDPEKPSRRRTVPKPIRLLQCQGRTAFRLLDRIDHSSITLNGKVKANKPEAVALDLIEQALTVDDAEFDGFCDRCDAETAALTCQPGSRKGSAAMQNMVVRVRDDFGARVEDYLLEFYDIRKRDGGALAKAIHDGAIKKVHLYRGDPSCRALYIDTAALRAALARGDTRFGLSITATPVLDDLQPVGFQTFGDEDILDLSIDGAEAEALFKPHQTLLVDLELPRLQRPDVFAFRGAQP